MLLSRTTLHLIHKWLHAHTTRPFEDCLYLTVACLCAVRLILRLFLPTILPIILMKNVSVEYCDLLRNANVRNQYDGRNQHRDPVAQQRSTKRSSTKSIIEPIQYKVYLKRNEQSYYCYGIGKTCPSSTK